MKVSRRRTDISSTEDACVQYESCTDAKAILSYKNNSRSAQIVRLREEGTNLAGERSHHHVGGIEGVNEVGRERGCLRSSVDFGGNGGIDDEDGLQSRSDLDAPC